MKIKLIIFLLLIILISLLGTVFFKTRNNQEKSKDRLEYQCDHCNIMLIDIDILRADELPCYGYFRDTAPNLCAFAKKSILFKNNFSTATWTLPSIFSTITSLYPTFHRVRTTTIDRLNEEIPTLAEVLKENGYFTVYVGDDLQNSPLLSSKNGGLRGYDLITQGNISEIIKNAPKDKPWFIHFYNSDLHMPYLISGDEKVIDTNMKPPSNLLITESDFDKSLDQYLRESYKEVFTQKAIDEYSSVIFSKRENPYDFSVLDLFYKIQRQGEEISYLRDVWKSIYNTYVSTFDIKNKSDIEYIRMMYDTNIKTLDGNLTHVLTENFEKDTVTIVMSDHGEAFGENGTFSHDDNHHTNLFYTPLIIYSPNLENKIVNQTTSNIDIFPTILDLVNIPKIDGLQGKSLIDYIKNVDIATTRFVFGETNNGYIMQNKDWLYYSPYYSNITKSLLYDKNSDVNEKDNVINDYPSLAKNLFSQVKIIHSYHELSLNNESDSNYLIPTDLSPEKIEKLKKEGYF